MAYERKVDLVLTGKIAEGRNIDEVKAAVGQAFRRSPPEVDHLFANVPFYIKRDLPESQLARYLEILAGAGALVEVKPAASAVALIGAAAVAAAPAPTVYGPAPPPGARASTAAPPAANSPFGGFAPPAPTQPPLAQSLAAAPSVYGPSAPPVGPPPTATAPPGPSAPAAAPSIYAPAAPPSASAPAQTPTQAVVGTASVYNTVLAPGTQAPPPAASSDEKMVCPKCGAVQGKRTLCLSCGVDMPRYKAANVGGGGGRETVAATGSAFNSTGANFQRYAAPRATLRSEDVHELPSLLSLSSAGRIGRLRFLAWQVPILLVAVVVGALAAVAVAGHGAVSKTVLLGGIGVSLLAGLAYSVRLMVLRLHDLDKTGWFGLLVLFPLLNLIFALYLLFAPGTQGANAYGPPPEENTPLVYIGAVLTIALQVFGLVGRGHTH